MSINIIHALGEASLDDPHFVVGFFATLAFAALSSFFAVYWWGSERPGRRTLVKYWALAAAVVTSVPHIFFGIFASLPTFLPGGSAATRFHYSIDVAPFILPVWFTVVGVLLSTLVMRVSLAWRQRAHLRQGHT